MNSQTRVGIGCAGIAVLLTVMGCSAHRPAGSRPTPIPQESLDLFTAAVRYFDERTEAPILVDPRPLRPEARLDSVAEGDLMNSDSGTIRLRTRVMARAGWRLTDAPADWRCVFSQTLPPPLPRAEPDSLRLRYEGCRQRGPYQSLVLGLPQSDPAPGRWRIRTMRMLTYGYEVADLFLEQNPAGEWVVAEVRVLAGVFS